MRLPCSQQLRWYRGSEATGGTGGTGGTGPPSTLRSATQKFPELQATIKLPYRFRTASIAPSFGAG